MHPKAQDQPVVPTAFETERLTLRPLGLKDAPELHLALTESVNELREYLWHVPWIAEEQTLSSAQSRCKDALENFQSHKDFAYLAFAKSTGRLVGSVGLHRPDWALRTTEVGYWVRSSEAGRGYASEMVNAITPLALGAFGVDRVELVTDERNAASRKVAERCGFSLECVTPQIDKHEDGVERSNCVYVKSN